MPNSTESECLPDLSSQWLASREGKGHDYLPSPSPPTPTTHRLPILSAMDQQPPPLQGTPTMPDSINSALALEHQVESPISPDSARPGSASAESSARKRKKAAENGDEGAPAEPRRLRRSHEACARCRSKKIKVSATARCPPRFAPIFRRHLPSTSTILN